MDWQAVGAIGEVAGAVAVVITLIYLAGQVRLTRRVWIRQNERDLSAHYVANSALFVNNPDMAGIHLRGMSDSQELTDEERMRWHMFLWPFLAGLQEAVEDQETGIYGSENIDTITEGAANVFRTPGGSAWWRQNNHLFRAGFREYMDKAIASGTFSGLDVAKF